MMTMHWSVLFCIILIFTICCVKAQTSFNCSANKFPPVYSAEIEITGDEWTGTLHEVYDRETDQDRLRISFLTHEGYSLVLLDFRKDEGYHINQDGDCHAFHPQEQDRIKKFNINPETGHLYTTEALLNFDNKVHNETLSGEDVIRGIKTEVCVAHMHMEQGNFNATWDAYFHWAAPEWEFASKEENVPVAVILDGEFTNATDTRHGHIEYHFTDFVTADQVPEFIFDKPEQCPSAHDHDLPQLEDNFLATAEYKFPGINATMMLKEAVDYQNNRIAFLTWFGGQETFVQLDIESKEAYLWYENRTCQSMHIDEASQLPFVGANGHILHASDLFVIQEKYNDTYWGETTVRDIPANEWRATIHPENSPEPIEVHMMFSKEGWGTSGHGTKQAVPLRSRMFRANDDEKTEPLLDIDFIEFVPGVPNSRYFEKPDFCESVNQDAVPLPTLPDDFSTAIDAVIVNKGYTVGLQEYYDYSNNRLRFDTHHHNSSVIEIIMLNDGKMYTITNGTDCSSSSFDPDEGPPISKNGRLYRGRDLFNFAAQNETYYGTHKVRGVEANHWRSHFTGDFRQSHISYDADFYFSTADWHFAHNQKQVPMRIHIEGHTLNRTTEKKHHFDHYYEFTDYISGTPDPEHFALPDICQDHGFLADDPAVQGAEVAGIAIGVAIIAVALGFVIGALSVYFYSVKRVGRSKSSTFREMDDMGQTSDTMHS